MIRCNETAALDIPVKLARWLEAQGKAGHAEAAALLLDSRLDPTDRTRQAIARIADRRYVLVFDNFESVMALEDKAKVEAEVKTSSTSALSSTLTSAYPVADPNLAAFFAGLLAARWRGLCLFTGRYRWAALDEHLGRGAAAELHLPELTRAQAIMLMDNLPRLRREPIATKLAVYRKVGGHPKSIELLEGWLASGRVTDLLTDPNLDGMLAQQWADYFLRALLAQLTAAERDALARLCIFETSLDQEAFDYAEVKPEWVRRWLDLSLVQRAGGGMPDIPPHMQGVWDLLPESEKRKLAPPALYTVHPVVREYLIERRTEDERRRAHEWAAAFYGRPFVEMARQMVRPGRAGDGGADRGVRSQRPGRGGPDGGSHRRHGPGPCCDGPQRSRGATTSSPRARTIPPTTLSTPPTTSSPAGASATAPRRSWRRASPREKAAIRPSRRATWPPC